MMNSEKYTLQKIVRLILLSLYDRTGKPETEELQKWQKEHKNNQHFYQKISSPSYLEQGLQEYSQYDSRHAWEQMKLQIQNRKKRFIRRLLPYAAIVILLISTVILTRFQYPAKSPEPQITTTKLIRPGSSKAQLILSDGQQIELEAGNGRLCRPIEGENFLNDGKLLDYRQQPFTKENVTLHTLRTPRGGEYQLVLSDGTRIWMNADSELVYPEHFTGPRRKVELKGEAYFEVAQNTECPFHVVVGDMEVKVLGTSFNISAYPNAKRQTTLAEGSVTVHWQQQEMLIRPGQQVTESNEGLQVKQVNVANYTGWKDRRFIYENQNLGEVLKELERWYDVEIITADQTIGTLHLTANLPKYENIDKVLNIIEYAACVKFEIKNRKIIIRRD